MHLRFLQKESFKKQQKQLVILIGNKIANAAVKSHDGRISKNSKYSQQNNLESVTNEHEKEISKEKYVSLEERQEIDDELRIKQYSNGILKHSQQNNSETNTNH